MDWEPYFTIEYLKRKADESASARADPEVDPLLTRASILVAAAAICERLERLIEKSED